MIKRSEVKENDIPDIIERFNNLDKEVDKKKNRTKFLCSNRRNQRK